MKLTNQVSTFAAAATWSSSSGESKAASRTPRGGRIEPETPWPQQLEFGLSGEEDSFKNSSECGNKAPKKIRHKASSLRIGGRDHVSGETRLTQSLGRTFETRPHPCKQGDVTKSQGSRAVLSSLRKRRKEARDSLAAAAWGSLSGESRAVSRTPRGGGTEPETPWPQQLED